MPGHSRWADLKTRRLAEMSQEERERYDAAYAEARRDRELGQLIYDLRTEAGLTQAELAERMGTTQSAISRLEEGGGGAPKLDTLVRLAAALGRGLRISFPYGEDDPAVVLREPAA
ncbi:MAG: helix-turn-helix domain-containing protein [Egibacteraceae bacterium]